MNYAQFLNMIPEASLMVMLVIIFIADFASSKKGNRKWFNPLVCCLMLFQVLLCLCPEVQNLSTKAFGGMYATTPAVNVMKTILALGTLIVLIQARGWLSRKDTSFKEGEFYLLIFSTLLGMNMMMSAGHFLLFFLGLEMASIPMACLVALDKYRHNSAEAAAKFILMAIFSSGVMLYGISFIYASAGTLYFSNVPNFLVRAQAYTNWLGIMGMIFFISGLGFKISLVPFHYWTADAYQGAPTTVTGYLSVISKGAAAFTLASILIKVLSPLVEYWLVVMYILIALTITVGNLFAI
ncbi:MAG: NADH-quinone oxidoreductase subunit N, partial [Prevotella sp.]|nr:NADH-quinone oxidoreductase subunit N [Prevotella sp.]